MNSPWIILLKTRKLVFKNWNPQSGHYRTLPDIMKYCKLTNDQVVWIESDKSRAVQRFRDSEDCATSYLIAYNGIKKSQYDVLGIGDSVKKYDMRIQKFVKFPKFYYAHINTKREIEYLTTSIIPGPVGPVSPVGPSSDVCLSAPTALYYYDN